MKNFILTKNKFKKTENQPDYKLSVNLGDKENTNWVEGGAGWIRKNSKGNTFLSVVLSDAFVDHTRGIARKGFSLQIDGSNGNDMPDMPEEDEEVSEDSPF